MKKVLLIMTIMVLSMTAFGEGFDMDKLSYGGQLSLATEDYLDFGIGARAEYPVDDLFEGLTISTYLNIFFPGDDFSAWQLGVNGLYDVYSNDMLDAYAGGGLSYDKWSWDGPTGFDWDYSEIALNMVGGAKFTNISDSMTPFAELTWNLTGFETFVITGGVLF